MKRFKRLYLLTGILAAACLLTFAVSQYESRKEAIRESGETILDLSQDSVQTLSWDCGDSQFSFHRGEDDTWIYDGDEAFPVDQEKLSSLLSLFSPLSSSFIIEEPDDLGAYGLNSPECTIDLTLEDDQAYTITLGDFSTMDAQRYVSIGDGNVYLVPTDPLDLFDVELRELIDQDDVPYLSQTREIRFSGEQNYTVTYAEDSSDAQSDEDLFFTTRDGETVPLDTYRVEDYLSAITSLDLTNYVTYTADEDMLSQLGLDDPQLVIEVDYLDEDDDSGQVLTFQLSVSRDPEELAQAQAAQTQEDSDASEEEAEEEEITAYARVGDSQILYQITGEEYTALMAAAYDDLRHQEVLPVDFEEMTQLDITLDGESYAIAAQGGEDDRTYLLGDEEVDLDDVIYAMECLTADSFTDQSPTGKEEIRLTLTSSRASVGTVEVALFRQDGSFCLAQVNGQSVSLIPRDQVVDLMEAVNAIVLG